MKNWKTTLAGLMAPLGLVIQTNSRGPVSWWVGAILIGMCPTVLGLVSKDHDKTGPNNSEIK